MWLIAILWRLCDALCFFVPDTFFFLGGVARGVVLIAVALSHRMLMNYFRSSCSMLLKMKCFRVDT